MSFSMTFTENLSADKFYQLSFLLLETTNISYNFSTEFLLFFSFNRKFIKLKKIPRFFWCEKAHLLAIVISLTTYVPRYYKSNVILDINNRPICSRTRN